MTIQPETTLPATETTTSQPAQDERITAALAHIGIALPLTGLLLPVFIWLTQKDKSAFVRFQALQALAWHLALLALYFFGGGCYTCSAFGTFMFIPFMSSTPRGTDPSPLVMLPILAPILLMLFFIAVGGLIMIMGIVGAVLALQGKDFRYPIIGRRVEKFLATK